MNQVEVLAIWGAVTGTIGTVAGLIGLWLRFKQHSLDKPKLICDAYFEFDSPNQPKHKLTVRSLGRRPVVIDEIKYFITPKNLIHCITKLWQHKKGHWLSNQELRQKIKLNEGEKTEIKISLPNGLDITEIYKAEVIDQTGRTWPIKWQSHSTLVKIATQETLNELSLENEKRFFSAIGYRLGERYYIQTNFNTKPTRMGVPCGKGFWFFDLKKYEEKFIDIKDLQAAKFLSGEIEKIQ